MKFAEQSQFCRTLAAFSQNEANGGGVLRFARKDNHGHSAKRTQALDADARP
jgi:hypothetical protein